jgi:hypothetical protein
MGDAAHVESPRHEVFSSPFKVEPKIETWPRPGNYLGFPGGDELPEKMPVWRVQDTGKATGGVVARSWGFTDSPDAEVQVLGYNLGKEYGAVGVGRQGNFLQWGYWAPPSKMTEAGRKLFLNCVCYVHKFDGKRPLVRVAGADRIDPIRLGMLIGRLKDVKPLERYYPADVFARYRADPQGLIQYYKENYELIYRDGNVYRIDADLQSLGIDSNRKVGTLDRLIALLRAGTDEQKETAQRELKRYTTEDFQTPDQWQAWLDESRGRIYFSDVGGYKFRVVPKGYLE